MANRSRIIGLRKTQAELMMGMEKIRAKLPSVLKDIGKSTTEQAKGRAPVDTGALRDSIHDKEISKGPDKFQRDVVLGKQDIARGRGRYLRDAKNRKVSFQLTTEYASDIDEFGSPLNPEAKGFFSTDSFNHAKLRFLRNVRRILKI